MHLNFDGIILRGAYLFFYAPPQISTFLLLSLWLWNFVWTLIRSRGWRFANGKKAQGRITALLRPPPLFSYRFRKIVFLSIEHDLAHVSSTETLKNISKYHSLRIFNCFHAPPPPQASILPPFIYFFLNFTQHLSFFYKIIHHIMKQIICIYKGTHLAIF